MKITKNEVNNANLIFKLTPFCFIFFALCFFSRGIISPCISAMTSFRTKKVSFVVEAIPRTEKTNPKNVKQINIQNRICGTSAVNKIDVMIFQVGIYL